MCVRVVPRVQSKLSRALHAHRGKKLLQGLQNLENTTMKRAMVRFRGAREKGAVAFVECLGVSQEDTMEGSHDAGEIVGSRQGTTRLHATSSTKPSAPPGTASIPSREQSTVCC